MAKSKKKAMKRLTGKPVDISEETTLTILVPDELAELPNKILHSVGRLAGAASKKFGADEVAIVKSSEIKAGTYARAVWQKNLHTE